MRGAGGMLVRLMGLGCCGAMVAGAGMLGQALASSQMGTEPGEGVYGPYAFHVLQGGNGVSRPLGPRNVPERRQTPEIYFGPRFEAAKPWSLTVWFKDGEAGRGSGVLAELKGVGRIALDGGMVKAVVGGKELAGVAEAAGGWQFAALVSDGSEAKLYVGAAQTAKVAVALKSAGKDEDSELEIAPASDGPHFGGYLAGLSLYYVALSADAVKALSAKQPEDALVHFAEASPSWPVQYEGQTGLQSQQDPATLPRGNGGFSAPVAKPLPSGVTAFENAGPGVWNLRGGWRLAAAPDVSVDGGAVSSSAYDAGGKGWYAATVPGTVLTTLIDRGVYPDPDYGLNNMAIPETLARQDYWYRAEFEVPADLRGKRLTLGLEGVNYVGEVWLNGQRLGAVKGAFLRGRFPLTAIAGKNVVAIRVSPPPHPGIPHEESVKAGPGANGGIQMLDGPAFGDTEGWDWIPGIRDRDTGLWQDVTLRAEGDVSVGDLNVVTTLPQGAAGEADVEIEVPLANHAAGAVEGDVVASFDDVKVVKHVSLKAGENVVRLEPAEEAQLRVQHPKLWWPNGYGEPALHALTVEFHENGAVSSAKKIDFGMREVSYELSMYAANGHLNRYEVLPARTHDSGVRLIDERHEGIRTSVPQTNPDDPSVNWANWVHTVWPGAEETASVREEKDAHWLANDLVIKVNGVRIAARGGNWGMDDSRKRVSIEHLEPYFRLHRDAHVNMIRNWQGMNSEENFYTLADKYGLMVWNDFWDATENSNAEPEDPQLFLKNAKDTIRRFRSHPSIVVWCGRNEGVPQPIINEGLADLIRNEDHTRYYTGSSNAVNLRSSGPYMYKSPDTYYRINRGFSVELGVPSVPTLESLKAWIPKEDLWPVSDTWAYHDWHQGGNGDVKPFMDHMAAQFGAPAGLEDFESKAQMMDYVEHRAIFEGFNAHLWEPNSGRMLWMTQPAWPSTMWQILSSDYDTQASFYGVEKACEPVHVQLDLTNNHVDLINLGAAAGYTVSAKIVSLSGKSLFEKSQAVSIGADARAGVFTLDLDAIAAGHAVIVKLSVAENGKPVSDNLYWWSKEERALHEMDSMTKEKVTARVSEGTNAAGERQLRVTLKNESNEPVLAIKLTAKDAASGERLLPAYYSDNYVSLLGGEEKVVTIDLPRTNAKAVVGLRGWNAVEASVQ